MRTGDSHELFLFTRKTLIVVAIVLAIALLWTVRDIALLVFIAGVIATGIAPAVRRVQILGRHYVKRKIRRGTAGAFCPRSSRTSSSIRWSVTCRWGRCGSCSMSGRSMSKCFLISAALRQ